ncbi:MAG: CPBP family intramembrane glutamic endopeptidase [Caldilineales bacterium]
MESAITLFTFVVLAMILVLANMEQYHRAFRWLTLAILALLNLFFMLLGVSGLALEGLTDTVQMPDAVLTAYVSLFRVMGIAGLLAFLPMLPPVRRLLARVLFINPASTVHTTALVYAIYLLGSGIGQQPLMSNPEALEGLEAVGGVSAAAIWSQALGMVLVAVSGVGLFTRRSLRQVAERLDLRVPTVRQVLVGAGAVVVLFALQIGVTAGWQALDPEGLAQIDDASSLLLGNLTGLSGAFTVGMAAALGEELIFRGALQPVFRLLPTALLFTLLHSQYAITPATVLILIIALILGVVRNRTNLTIAILVHFAYNFLSVILAGAGQ